MNCFNEELIQRIADNEIKYTNKPVIETHLKTCTQCVERLALKTKQIDWIKETMAATDIEPFEIPIFKPPFPKTIALKNWRHSILYGLSAACVLLAGILLTNKKPLLEQEERIIYQSIEIDIDANKPLSEQEYVMHIVDPEGNVTECFY